MHAAHFAIAVVEHGLILGVCRGGLFAVAPREALVDFVVQAAADGFADALELGLEFVR